MLSYSLGVMSIPAPRKAPPIQPDNFLRSEKRLHSNFVLNLCSSNSYTFNPDLNPLPRIIFFTIKSNRCNFFTEILCSIFAPQKHPGSKFYCPVFARKSTHISFQGQNNFFRNQVESK